MGRVIVALTLVAGSAALPAARADDRPVTVPALREWTPAGGTFALGADLRIVVGAGPEWLPAEAATLAEDVGELLGSRPLVTSGDAAPGDIVVASSVDAGLGDEGYELRVDDVFTIDAPTAAGVFYGGRTLLQLIRGGAPIPRGSARDGPLYSERGLSLDIARAFFPPEWLLARVRELADLKLNVLHLHVSDNESFPIESESHPEIVSAEHLTKDDVRTLAAEAHRNHVTIIPELDMPGHMTAALAAHPELQLTDVAGRRAPDKLDVTLDAARDFAADLLDEYLPLFEGPWWHTGADEYLGYGSTPANYELYPQLRAYAQAKYGLTANGHDAFLDFVNWVGDRVTAAGKQLRVWSDGIAGGSAVSMRDDAAVEWWENLYSPSPAELVADGYRVLNVGWWPLYYVTGGFGPYMRASEADMYERWDAHHFEGPATTRWFTREPGPGSYDLEPGHASQLGAALAVWNDGNTPKAQPDTLAVGIAWRLRILAQKTWASTPLTSSYDDFRALTATAAGP